MWSPRLSATGAEAEEAERSQPGPRTAVTGLILGASNLGRALDSPHVYHPMSTLPHKAISGLKENSSGEREIFRFLINS